MTQKDKDLLLKDLSSRLPYGVIVETPKGKGHVCDINLTIFCNEVGVNINPTSRDKFNAEDVKPYLFPLSSMTEEQTEELLKLINTGQNDNNEFMRSLCRIEFYHKNHFDYRGLIPKGLANDATSLNIY
jgi:hypothetical protein